MRLNNRQMSKAIHDRTPAQNSTGSLRLVLGSVWYTGRLPDSFVLLYKESRGNSKITHTVLSYQTPIAWRLTDGSWVIPETSYSVTTSRHQGIVRVATSAPESYFAQDAMSPGAR